VREWACEMVYGCDPGRPVQRCVDIAERFAAQVVRSDTDGEQAAFSNWHACLSEHRMPVYTTSYRVPTTICYWDHAMTHLQRSRRVQFPVTDTRTRQRG
jgi:hypothetical protein